MNVFLQIMQTTGSVALISLVLAAIISAAEKVLNNYGVCKIDINDGERELEVDGGSSLLSTLASQKIFIPSACGGKATCGLCLVQVKEGAGPLLPTEEPYLDSKQREEGYRLSCQIKVKTDMVIYVPDELFKIKEYNTTVSEIVDLTHDIKLVKMSLPEGETIEFKAGQFMQFYTKPYGKIKETVFRAYSIASPPSVRDRVDLLIRLVPDGIATGFVHSALKEGDHVQLSGPYGDFYLRGGEGVHKLIMVAGGSGMAPMLSLLGHIFEHELDYEIEFYFGAATMRDLFYLEEFRELEAAHTNFHFIPAIGKVLPEDDWEGETGSVVTVMAKYVTDAEGKEAYLCGSPGMLDATCMALYGAGFEDDQIFFDKF